MEIPVAFRSRHSTRLDGWRNKSLCNHNQIGFLLNLSCSFLTVIAELSLVWKIAFIPFIVSSSWHYQYQLAVVLVRSLMIFNYMKQTCLAFREVHEFDERKWIGRQTPSASLGFGQNRSGIVFNFIVIGVPVCRLSDIFCSIWRFGILSTGIAFLVSSYDSAELDFKKATTWTNL